MPAIRFNNPRLFGQPGDRVSLAIAGGDGAGGAPYGQRCSQWLRDRIGSAAAVITPSCTAALELAALAIGLEAGDEVVMPSSAFPSLAAAVALRGARPVFVDIRQDTLGLDEERIEQAVTSRTRAICTLNYAGVAGDVDRVRDIADAHGLRIVEDNAHGLCATYRGRPLGSFGDLSALSFHATKNVQIGEGGALLVNDPTLVERIVTLKNKGTNRRDFDLGLVAKYQWVELGSSPLIGEVPAALLWSQLLEADEITAQRRAICAAYREAFSPLADKGLVELPFDVPGVRPDGHAFCVLAGRPEDRPHLIGALADAGIQATFHYVPLHASPAGRRYGRTHGSLAVTERVAATIIRLPVCRVSLKMFPRAPRRPSTGRRPRHRWSRRQVKCLPQTAICEARADEGLRHALNGPAAQGTIEIDAPCDWRHAPLLPIGQRLRRDDIVLLGPGHRPEDAR